MFYTDEVTPSNPLATLNKRKFQAMYWSFLEFGLNALSREEAWFTVCIEFTVTVNSVSAGLSQVVAAILRLFFSEGHNFQTTGVLLHHNVRMWAKLVGLRQDGGAHKYV